MACAFFQGSAGSARCSDVAVNGRVIAKGCGQGWVAHYGQSALPAKGSTGNNRRK